MTRTRGVPIPPGAWSPHRTRRAGHRPGRSRRVPVLGASEVKRAATPPPASPQRTIGEILLEHGYVTQEDLAAAVQRQEETGFPLGQILVEAGAITRLELASALAVQWADVAPARGPARGADGRARPAREEEEEDDNEAPLFSYAAPAADDAAGRDPNGGAGVCSAPRRGRAQSRRASRRDRRGEGEPDFDVEARFSDLLGPLARHVDETAHRVQALEAAVEDVGTQSRAVGEAAESIREELARRATAATAAIDELAARLDEARLPEHSESVEPAELDGLRTEVAHLRAEVTAFAATQHADPTARDQLTTSPRVSTRLPTRRHWRTSAVHSTHSPSGRPPIPSSPVGSRSSPHDSTTWRDAARRTPS